MMDRRLDPRVEIRLPCHVSPLSGKSRFFVGVTENMSRSGILVLWNARALSKLPQPGELLALEIELPASHTFGRRCIHCQVTAVRISKKKTSGSLVAFQINQMQFKSASTKIAALENQEELSQLLM